MFIWKNSKYFWLLSCFVYRHCCVVLIIEPNSIHLQERWDLDHGSMPKANLEEDELEVCVQYFVKIIFVSG